MEHEIGALLVKPVNTLHPKHQAFGIELQARVINKPPGDLDQSLLDQASTYPPSAKALRKQELLNLHAWIVTGPARS